MLKTITIEDYLHETNLLNKQIDKYNEELLQFNIDVYNWNKKVNKEIEIPTLNLNSWNDYIEVDGEKYGFPHDIYQDVHRVDDCFGKVSSIEDLYECNLCRNWNGCDGRCRRINYFCDKCGQIENSRLKVQAEPYTLEMLKAIEDKLCI